jgi:phosphotransferase system enzyme I (PtsI)
LTEDVIVIAHDLLPSDTATLNRQRVKGIVTEIGGSNSHSAILARSFQIPAVLGVADAMKEIPDGVLLGMDALSGILIVNPDEEELTVLEEKKMSFLKKRQMEEEYLDKPGKLKDGALVIDAGVAFDEEGRICGDCDKALYDDENILITTVPGGVGLATRLQLMKNIVSNRLPDLQAGV